jgi:hypothetical protein
MHRPGPCPVCRAWLRSAACRCAQLNRCKTKLAAGSSVLGVPPHLFFKKVLRAAAHTPCSRCCQARRLRLRRLLGSLLRQAQHALLPRLRARLPPSACWSSAVSQHAAVGSHGTWVQGKPIPAAPTCDSAMAASLLAVASILAAAAASGDTTMDGLSIRASCSRDSVMTSAPFAGTLLEPMDCAALKLCPVLQDAAGNSSLCVQERHKGGRSVHGTVQEELCDDDVTPDATWKAG